jgi:hypothetical protein
MFTPVKTGPVTVNVVCPETEPEVAVTVVVPGLTPDAFPPALIVATVVFEETHTTELVKSAVLLFV